MPPMATTTNVARVIGSFGIASRFSGPSRKGCRLKKGRPCARPIRVPAPAQLDAYVDDARKQWRIYLGAMHRPDVLSGGLKFKIAVAVQVAAAGTAFSVETRSSGR